MLFMELLRAFVEIKAENMININNGKMQITRQKTGEDCRFK